MTKRQKPAALRKPWPVGKNESLGVPNYQTSALEEVRRDSVAGYYYEDLP